MSFLRAHPGQVSPITSTLWGGDLAPLSAKGEQARTAIASFARRFESILRQLRAAAPTGEIIVIGAWNPEADRLPLVEPPEGQASCRSTVKADVVGLIRARGSAALGYGRIR